MKQEEYLKHYKMELRVLSPMFIGNGEKIGKKEYIYVPFQKKIFIPDLGKMYESFRKSGLEREYQEYVLKSNNQDFSWWLKEHGYRVEDYQKWAKYELDTSDSALSSQDRQVRPKEILCFVKDAYGMPYIPGSSIKGMIRTALLTYEIKKHPEKYEKIKSEIWDNRLEEANRKKYLSREAEDLEIRTFHTLNRPKENIRNAVNSVMSGLIIGDSSSIDTDRLSLCQKVEYNVMKQERLLPILRETVIPGTKFEFDLTIDTKICPYTIETIREALDLFNQLCYSRFYSKFDRGDNRKGIVWLGGGVGFLSKTIPYALFEETEAVELTTQIFKHTLNRKMYNDHKHFKDQRLGASPHICKCTRYKNQLYDMGRCQLRVLKE